MYTYTRKWNLCNRGGYYIIRTKKWKSIGNCKWSLWPTHLENLQLSQQELTSIFRNIPQTRKDIVLLYASCSSPGYDDEHTYFNIFRPRLINGRWLTAIQYTTAIGLVSMVELFLDGKLGEKGYRRQEEVLLSDVYSTTYGSVYREQE